MMKIVM
jgi:hypothetical protein